MSTSATARPSTSAERSPQNSISPAIARSRSVRKLASSAVVSARSRPRGSRRGSRTRSPERRFGLPRWASSPPRSPAAARRAAAPRGSGFGAAGSRIAQYPNRPATAASRRLMVAGA